VERAQMLAQGLRKLYVTVSLGCMLM
jgi:hypothetical protein